MTMDSRRESAPAPAAESVVDGLSVAVLTSGRPGASTHPTAAAETRICRVVIAPGCSTGWHYHDGTVLAVVESGVLTRYFDGVPEPVVAGPGTSLVERTGPANAHCAVNLGDDPVVMYVTYLIPSGRQHAVPVPVPPAAHAHPASRRFGLLDLDGDGYLTWHDFEVFAARLLGATDAHSTSSAADGLRTALLGLWLTVLNEDDANADGRISVEEFATALVNRKVHERESLHAALRTIVDEVFAVVAPDGSGRLTMSQYTRLASSLGVSPVAAASLHGPRQGRGTDELTHQSVLDFALRFFCEPPSVSS